MKELRIMYIECCKNNGTDYLRLVKSQRVLNAAGIKTARKKTILNIGPLSRFDDGKPDYVERLKKSYKAGNPLIPELKPYLLCCIGNYENNPETVEGFQIIREERGTGLV